MWSSGVRSNSPVHPVCMFFIAAHYVLRGYNGELYGPGRVGEKKRSKFHPGDVIRLEFDGDAGTLTYFINGVSQGVCFSGVKGKTLHPAVCFYHGKAASASVSLLGSVVIVPATDALVIAGSEWTFDATSAMGVILSNGNRTVSNDGKGRASQ